MGLGFGSHGWSGGGAAQASELLDKAGVELLRDPLTAVYRPSEEVLSECEQVGAALAANARELAQGS